MTQPQRNQGVEIGLGTYPSIWAGLIRASGACADQDTPRLSSSSTWGWNTAQAQRKSSDHQPARRGEIFAGCGWDLPTLGYVSPTLQDLTES